MDIKSAYQQALQCEGFQADPSQAIAAEQLAALYEELVESPANPGIWQRALFKFGKRNASLGSTRGCYLWGDVGRGKTWLMDLFYQSLPFSDKSRLHFHEFMQQIHIKLKTINGKKDPLEIVAQDIALNNRLICLDEFHVSDISDAMLLYGLLDALFRRNVVLLMTSNSHPDDLYKNGLQRSRFMPAIELIKERNLLLHVQGQQDHRLTGTRNGSNYLSPLSPATDSELEEKFYQLAQGPVSKDGPVIINKRIVHYRMMAANVIWFDFEALCTGPRAASDYLYLAKNYDYVIVSNIYKMDGSHDDTARRFINLIDAIYDQQVGLVVSATGWPAELYTGNRFGREFNRTASRLEEMRSRNLNQIDNATLKESDTLMSC